MHNNRGYHQEVMFVTTMAARANRDVSRAGIGTKLIEPDIDYATMAKGYGMQGIIDLKYSPSCFACSARSRMPLPAVTTNSAICSRRPSSASST